MKISNLFKVFFALLFAFQANNSFATGGGRIHVNVIKTTLLRSFQDTIHQSQDKKVIVKGKKKEKPIKVLPKPHRQPVPLPVKVKVPKVKVIKPILKPVIKIIH